MIPVTKISGEMLESQGFVRIDNGEELIYAKRENNGITFYVLNCGVFIKYNITDIQMQRIEQIKNII
jgi:hypothetical protein